MVNPALWGFGVGVYFVIAALFARFIGWYTGEVPPDTLWVFFSLCWGFLILLIPGYVVWVLMCLIAGNRSPIDDAYKTFSEGRRCRQTRARQRLQDILKIEHEKLNDCERTRADNRPG